jgi:DNA-binding MarR family transcriptional regulator
MTAGTATIDRVEMAAALERLIKLIRSLSPPGDISLTAAATLARLTSDGPMRLTELAAAEHVTQPAMTQLVSRLERGGLAERRGNPDDRRLVMVHVTAAGRKLIAERRAARAERLSALLAQLTPDERTAIAAAVPAINRLVSLAE